LRYPLMIAVCAGGPEYPREFLHVRKFIVRH
jgi:hypothetical protein